MPSLPHRVVPLPREGRPAVGHLQFDLPDRGLEGERHRAHGPQRLAAVRTHHRHGGGGPLQTHLQLLARPFPAFVQDARFQFQQRVHGRKR